MRIARLIPLLALGALVVGCRDADPPLAPPSLGPRFSHTTGHGLEGKIAFTSNRYGSFHIFVMDADGSNVIQLTNGATSDFGPIWSPDGKRIAFGGCLTSCEVFIMNADGSGLTQLTNQGAFPGAWSPDGTRIAFGSDADGDGEVFIVNTDGSGVTQLTNNEVFFDFPDAWSPDGTRIAFGSNRDGNAEQYSMNVDGSDVIRLTDNPAEEARPAWSPDGARIAFTSDRDGGDYDIFVMNADGSGVTQLTQNDGANDDYAAWSPDGTHIAFESNRDGDTEIFVMDADGNGPIPVTSNDGVEDGGAAWVQLFAPSNDDFANAVSISTLPFEDIVDVSAASSEAGEPTPECSLPYGGGVSKTAWYRFTPDQTGSVSARGTTAQFNMVVAAYTGSSLGNLSALGCAVFGGTVTFRAEANRTYYFQVGGLFDQGGVMMFRLEVAPQPVAQFGFNPGDPSIFDLVQFFDFSFDPGGLGIQSQQWTFGDGAGATGCCPTHRYAADGSYTVALVITTPDGRTASTSQPVLVRTHDVAITKFSAPKAASSGQTRQIVVGINSRRYAETVEVQLFKSVPGGFQQVGFLTHSVPVRPSNRTTDYSFSYTFTAADAQIGKVTFKAVASILGARDALSGDNEAIAPPTNVGR